MDNEAAQEHWLDNMATHQTLSGMSDQPRQQLRQDPMQALINQAHRARSGQDEGISYLTCPF